MPSVSYFWGIIIRMFWGDHNPPHFHAVYQNYEAMFNIETGKMMEGYLPKRQKKLVEKWAKRYKDELLANWTFLQNDEPAKPIPPLRK